MNVDLWLEEILANRLLCFTGYLLISLLLAYCFLKFCPSYDGDSCEFVPGQDIVIAFAWPIWLPFLVIIGPFVLIWKGLLCWAEWIQRNR